MIILIGDWVCFQRNAELVIGVVRYIRTAKPWEDADTAITTRGEISVDRVLETRHPEEPTS